MGATSFQNGVAELRRDESLCCASDTEGGEELFDCFEEGLLHGVKVEPALNGADNVLGPHPAKEGERYPKEDVLGSARARFKDGLLEEGGHDEVALQSYRRREKCDVDKIIQVVGVPSLDEALQLIGQELF